MIFANLKTFFHFILLHCLLLLLAGVDFLLHDDDKEEEEEEEEEVQDTHNDGKIFHLPQDFTTYFCYFVHFSNGLVWLPSTASQLSIFSLECFQLRYGSPR